MSVTDTIGTPHPTSALARLEPALIAFLWVFVLVLSILWQQRWGVIPDTSWLIHVSQRVLAGERLYVDVIETNPPFSIWLYLPLVWLAQHLGISGEAAVHGFTRLAAVAGLGGAGLVAHRAGFLGNVWLVRLSPLLLALLILFPGNAFSQRDHIGAALFLPFLVLMAWRVQSGERSVPGLGLTIVVGLAGSLFVLVKPHYGAVVTALAVYLWLHFGFIRILKLPEFWTIGAVCCSYLAAVFAIHPQFVFELFPLLSDTYLQVSARDRPFWFIPGWLVPFLLTWWIGRGRPLPVLAKVSMLAAVAALFVALVQGKGWPYHFYPAVLFAFVALVVVVADRLASTERPRSADAAWLAIALAGLAASWAPFSGSQKPHAETVAAIQAEFDGPRIASIATDLAVGHPLTPMTKGRWVSVHHGDWLGGYAFLLREQAMQGEDDIGRARYDALLREFIEAKRAEFRAEVPDILLVQKSNPVWWAVLMEEFGFADIMVNYELFAEDSAVEVYRRLRPTPRP